LAKLSTLDDLERPIRIPLLKRCVFGAHYKNLNKYTRKLSAAKMLANYSSFWKYMVYADIRGGSSGWGVKWRWGCRRRQFAQITILL